MARGGTPQRCRLIAADLDGTLLRNDGTISSRTRAALEAAEAAGINVVFVTARPPRTVDPMSSSISLHPIAICANGALVYDMKARRILREHPLQPSAAAEIVRRLRAALPAVAFAVEAGLRYGREPAYRPRLPIPANSLVGDAERLVAEPVAKLIARDEGAADHWQLLDRARQVVGDLGEVTSSGPNAPIEISAPGISKAYTLAAVASDLGLTSAETVAFGDMPNDVPMLRWAGWSVAVANAHPEALSAADEATASNEDDGVAAVIERLV
jgi:hydroxymethylpyrimidine pyrophosphatase-like HAD family hydrolase